MGGCCGAMKTGQKSLPDKKKSSSDVAAQEKSNGKESVPVTDAGKTPTSDAEVQQQLQQQPVEGAEPAAGSNNVMDLETAVAPYEGTISNNDQPQIQANVAADPELLLPYQIPVQHTFSSTTATTTTTIRQEDVQLRVDEPQLNADFQDGIALSALANDLASSSTGDFQVETVTKVTETVTTEAIPAVPELGVSGSVEFSSTGASGETVEEPVAVVIKSSYHEAQRLPEEILPSGELEGGSGLTEEVRVATEVPLPGLSGKEPEPTIMVCPLEISYPEPPKPDSHFIAVCPPEDPAVVFSGFDHQLSPGKVVVSESMSEGERVPHAEFAIGEPSGLVQDSEQKLVETAEIQQQVVADLETAPDSATESSSVPGQDIQVNASLELPEQSVGEPLSTNSPFEAQPSAVELHDQAESEFATTSPQQSEDYPSPLQQDQASEPLSVEGVADLSVTLSLPEENVKEKKDDVTGSSQLEQDQATEPEFCLQDEESQSRHQEFGQEPYQEQQHSEEASSYRAASGVESFEVQDPVSVSDVIQTVETRPVIESVSEEAHESRNTWWKEGGQPETEGEIPVVETVSDQAQQSRQAWWEESGSGPSSAPQHEDLPVEPLSPRPDDLPSIPPPPPPTSEEEEQAVITTPSIPAEIDGVSPSSDSFPEVIPEPLPSTFDQGTSGGGGGATVESPLSSVDGSTLPTENGEVSVSSDEAFTPASVLSPEESTTASNLSPDGVEPPAAAAAASSSKEPIPAQA